jgi:hypothetical protein
MYPLFENRGIIAPSGSPISLKKYTWLHQRV